MAFQYTKKPKQTATKQLTRKLNFLKKGRLHVFIEVASQVINNKST